MKRTLRAGICAKIPWESTRRHRSVMILGHKVSPCYREVGG